LFGISEGTTRVALSRLTADGDVVADGGYYRLSMRLIDRQNIQDETVRPSTKSWRGAWELAVADPAIQNSADRARLGAGMARLRLAELRPGVWLRPDNLTREWPESVADQAWRFESRSNFAKQNASGLVSGLWDLAGWAATAEILIRTLASTREAAARFELAAAIVRHLRHDPILPQSLLPDRWPGGRLRAVYSAYRRELGQLIASERDRNEG
jgi:phenylacetic acid degradation operon negative regulatory protein